MMEPSKPKSVIHRSAQERRDAGKADLPYLTDERADFMDQRSGKDRRAEFHYSALMHSPFPD
jgi:hypothetical protein